MTNCPFGQRSLRMTLQLCVCDTTSQNSPLRWAKITHKSPSRALQKTLFFYVCFAEKTTSFLFEVTLYQVVYFKTEFL